MNALARTFFVSSLMASFVVGSAVAQSREQQIKKSPLQRLVTSVYKEYAWTIIFAPEQPVSPSVSLTQERLGKLRRVFADDLAQAIFDDAQCVRKTSEVCLLDFDILFDSQDVDARNLIIRSKTHQLVEACFVDQTEKQRCIEFVGVRSKNGVRISDMRYDQSGRSMRTILRLQ